MQAATGHKMSLRAQMRTVVGVRLVLLYGTTNEMPS